MMISPVPAGGFGAETDPIAFEGRPGRARPVSFFRPGRPMRILVVDGCADTAWSTAAVLRLQGEEARHACDGRAALRLAEEFLPDVVLIDFDLPGIDGCQLARELQVHPPLMTTLLVALTSYADRRHRWRAWQAGFDVYLLKPLDPRGLRRLLRAALASPLESSPRTAGV